MKQRVAFISEHASPLACQDGVGNGAQNVYVAELTKELVKAGYAVDIFTRKDNASQPPIVQWMHDIRVIHIKAGPEEYIGKEGLLPYMQEFADNMLAFIKSWQWHYDMMHANFFTSGLVASIVKSVLQIPYVITFHEMGSAEPDSFPKERFDIEKFIVKDADQVIAESLQDENNLIKHFKANPSSITVVPSKNTWQRVGTMICSLYETVLAGGQHQPPLQMRLFKLENFSIKQAIRSMMPESFYPVLNV